jgi:anaerobic magnesium-protoporphyrin IX monomethyl ester cyclase
VPMKTNSSRRVLLVQPPYGDVTYPYHSLAYVSAALRSVGYTVDVLDLNTIWFRSLFRRDTLRAWRAELAAEAAALDQRPTLPVEQQAELVELLQSIAACDWLNPEATQAIFQGEEFYDFDRYLYARQQVRAFEQLLSRLYPPFDFFTAFAVPPYEPSAQALVNKAVASTRYIADATRILTERTGAHDYLFCGVTIPFSANLTLGLATFEALSAVHPSAVRVVGGTAISDVYKYRAAPDSLLPFKRVCDYLYMGEAETGIEQLGAFFRGECPAPPSQVIDLARPTDQIRLQYIALSERAEAQKKFTPYAWQKNPPDYDWIEWDLYLAPEKRVNCSPSRGCFWNQCTFCDYGLNEDGPTAPSRAMDPETFVSHLTALAAQGIRHIYLAVDSIAPNFLSAFADRLLAAGLDIHWSSQFFLTKSFNDDLVDRLVRSGLRLASFGFESGSSRVLERMGKGKRHAEGVFRPVLDVFRRSPVGLQPLFFFGFPGEDDRDRQETVDFLCDESDVLCTVSKGGLFALLPGSIVAKDPARFGVRNIRRNAGDDIAGGLSYELDEGVVPPNCDEFRCFNRQLPHLDLFERPWAGGIDTFHTQLYIERHGRDVFHRLRRRGVPDAPSTVVSWSSRFDLEELTENVIIHQALATPAGRRRLLEALPDVDAETLVADMRELTRHRVPRRQALRMRLYHEPTEEGDLGGPAGGGEDAVTCEATPRGSAAHG